MMCMMCVMCVYGMVYICGVYDVHMYGMCVMWCIWYVCMVYMCIWYVCGVYDVCMWHV